MKIQSMFQKDIDRPINGVVKVMQDDQQSLKDELSEYIITKELRRHFATFFDNYVKTIDILSTGMTLKEESKLPAIASKGNVMKSIC